MSSTIESLDNMLIKKLQDGGAKKVSKKQEIKEASNQVSLSNNHIALDDIYRFSDLFFRQKNIMQAHLYNSSDKLLDEDIPNFLNQSNSTFFEKVTKDKVYRYKFKFTDIGVKPPFIDMDDEIMFPSDARLRNLTYASKIVATVTQIQEVTDIATGTVTSQVVGQPEYEYPITNIPIMVRSKYCSLSLMKGHNNSECEYDPGGYYIVNGSEKVVVSLERMIENRPLVFIKKESAVKIYTVQVNSKSPKTDMMQIINIRLKKDNTMTIRVPILNEIPVFILMRALGIESDSDIINYCVYDPNDIDMIGMVRVSLEQTKNEKGAKILSQSEAINYLMTKMRIIKKYTETDKDTKQKEKRLHLLQLLKENMLPHVENNYTEKAYYIGYMINRLLHCKLGRIQIDDRDSYINKRIDLPGQLIFELFKQYYKKMLNECNKFFKKRSTDDEKPLNIINQIKPNIIEQGLKTALLTGNWGKKKGVAQMLQRLTYLQTLASLRRINSPTADASNNKLTQPRHLHPSVPGPICLTWDTEILLDDGITVKQMGNITNNDRVTTINKKDLTIEPSKIKDKFVKMPDKLLKVTTISGRVIKGTPEHPLLVKTAIGQYEMKEIGKLKAGDLLVIKHTQKYLHQNKETEFMLKSCDIDEQYREELFRAGVLDRNFTQTELEIMGRLLGASITDGNIYIGKTNYHSCMFSLGEVEDAYDMADDIMKLGFENPTIMRTIAEFKSEGGKKTEYKTYTVQKNGAFAHFMVKIGAFVGRKTRQTKKLPEWIINANNRIIREFLSGFIGGDGSKISAHVKKKSHAIAMNSVSQSTSKEYLNDTITYVESISNMLKNFGINAKVSHTFVKDSEDEYQVWLDISNSADNLVRFADIVGYRYCNEKKRKSALPIEYVKYKNYNSQKRQHQYDELIKFANSKNRDYTIAKKVKEIGLNLRVAYKAMERYRKNQNIKALGPAFMPYSKFRELYFEKNDIVTIPIESIVEIPPEPVYDFTTISNNHSFIANGIVSSNCFVETSEGAKVGLVKNLSQIGSVTVMKNSQFDLLKGIIKQKVKNVQDIPINQYGRYTRVLLNGEIIGLTDTPRKLYNELKNMKYTGAFDQLVGIAHDIRSEIECRDLRINCDTGRIYHPAIRVDDNEIKLSKHMIDLISEEGTDSATKIVSWNQFMMKFPGVIEYLDPDEKANAMMAMYPRDVEEMRMRMTESIDLVTKLEPNDFANIINRYDRFTYVKYTHCEIDPNLLLGVVVANIPFLECNQGPRNIYQYSQARQAMGIYATNYRDRLDISYILYHPQRPIVTTRSMKYINTDKIPAGENCIVAIACYGGWNQEDSNFMSKAAIDFGLFRSTSVKKYMTTIQKNQSTSQDDIFIKPDRSQVAGMRHGSYDKLNEKGFAPEETRLENGDILIGKVSPIQAVGNSNKLFKDSSEHYKSHIPGTVDKVYTEIFNHEGYEMRKVRVRSERVPMIGDKFCCYDPFHEVLTTDGWVNIKDITLKHKVATLVNGKILEYMNPIAVQSYDYEGKMYVVDSNQVNLKVTPNHRMYVADREGKKYGIALAEDIYGKRRKYMKNCEDYKVNFNGLPKEVKLNKWKTEIEKYLVYNKYGEVVREFDIEPWLILFGIWIAEGSLNGVNAVHIAVHKDRVRSAVEKSCLELNIKLGKYRDKTSDGDVKNCYAINSIDIYRALEPNYGGSVNKWLPDWVWYLTRDQARILIKGMMLGDGHWMSNITTTRYDTSSIKLRNDFQRLVFHAGYSANYYLKDKSGSSHPINTPSGVKYITSTADAWRLTTVTVQNYPLVNKNIQLDGSGRVDRWEDFKGKVYCCTVPGDGIIYVRREGIPVWCGNSRSGQKGTNGIQLSASDMMFSEKGVQADLIINTNAIKNQWQGLCKELLVY